MPNNNWTTQEIDQLVSIFEENPSASIKYDVCPRFPRHSRGSVMGKIYVLRDAGRITENPRYWTSEEDSKLLFHLSQNGELGLEAIATILGRKITSVKSRVKILRNHGHEISLRSRKGGLTEFEHNLLAEIFAEHNLIDGKKIYNQKIAAVNKKFGKEIFKQRTKSFFYDKLRQFQKTRYDLITLDGKFYSTEAIVNMLGCSDVTVGWWIREGHLKGTMEKNKYYVRWQDLQSFIKKNYSMIAKYQHKIEWFSFMEVLIRNK